MDEQVLNRAFAQSFGSQPRDESPQNVCQSWPAARAVTGPVRLARQIAAEDDLFAEQEIVLVERHIEAALQTHGHTTEALPIRDDLWGPLRNYDPSEWLIFNLCESIRNKTYLEPYIISAFEHLGFRYTVG